ncbi:hypothetical protein PYCC9005_000561 [Savitreella phatthalungensis]
MCCGVRSESQQGNFTSQLQVNQSSQTSSPSPSLAKPFATSAAVGTLRSGTPSVPSIPNSSFLPSSAPQLSPSPQPWSSSDAAFKPAGSWRLQSAAPVVAGAVQTFVCVRTVVVQQNITPIPTLNVVDAIATLHVEALPSDLAGICVGSITSTPTPSDPVSPSQGPSTARTPLPIVFTSHASSTSRYAVVWLLLLSPALLLW